MCWRTVNRWSMCSVSPDRNGSVASPDCALYEVGGNIGEWKNPQHFMGWKQCWHLHVFMLIELMRGARPYVINGVNAKETRVVHLQLSEQTNAYYVHVCALTGELTHGTTKVNEKVQPVEITGRKLSMLHIWGQNDSCIDEVWVYTREWTLLLHLFHPFSKPLSPSSGWRWNTPWIYLNLEVWLIFKLIITIKITE